MILVKEAELVESDTFEPFPDRKKIKPDPEIKLEPGKSRGKGKAGIHKAKAKIKKEPVINSLTLGRRLIDTNLISESISRTNITS